MITGRISEAAEPQLQIVDLQLQRIRQHQRLLAEQEQLLLHEKTLYADRHHCSPGGQLTHFSTSDSDTLYSHAPSSSVSSSGSPSSSYSSGKHTSRIIIKSCPPPPPLRSGSHGLDGISSLDLKSSCHQGCSRALSSQACCDSPPKSRECSRCRVSSHRQSPPSSPSSSSGVSCSSHTLQSSSTVCRSKSFDALSSHLHDDSSAWDCVSSCDSKPYCNTTQSQKGNGNIPPAPPALNGLNFSRPSTLLKMSDNGSGFATPDAEHRTNLAAALSDVVSRRNAELSSDAADEGERALAFEAKIDALKREKPPAVNPKRLQHEKLMEELKQKRSQLFDGEDRTRSISPTSSTSSEVRYFGAASSKVPSSTSNGTTVVLNTSTQPKTSPTSTEVRNFGSTASKAPGSSNAGPKIAPNTLAQQGNTKKSTSFVLKPVKQVEIVEKSVPKPANSEPISSKIVNRSSTTVQTRTQTETVALNRPQEKSVSDDVMNGDDVSSARHFWKKQENVKKPSSVPNRPKGKAVLQATASFSGLKSTVESSSSSPENKSSPFPVLLKSINATPTIEEDVESSEPQSTSTSQLIKNFNKIASSAPTKTAPEKPKAVIIKTNTTTSEEVKRNTLVMTSGPSIDRTPKLVSTQVSSTYTIIPPPPSPSPPAINDFSKEINHQIFHKPSSYSNSGNTSKVYVSINGNDFESPNSNYTFDMQSDTIHSKSNSTTSYANSHFSKPDIDYSEIPFSELPPLHSTNLDLTIRNVSPSELIIPEPPSSTAVLSPSEIPRGVPPPPSSGDSWSERFESRLHPADSSTAAGAPRPDMGRSVSTEYKNIFTKIDASGNKPLVSINTYGS
ncbi:endochitinase A-like [Hyalella azteca]|uniref:Endochitinase A-like n=1 Tax=Hyalella azteca TaxID=294128 RepID=A0A979FMN7_HYAAZ|nr:endochitinase A-like [Hyalella azteca]